MHSNNENIDLLDYLKIIGIHKKQILINSTIAFVLSILLAFLLPKTYESTAKILPPQQDTGVMGLMLGAMGGGSGIASLAGGLLGASTPADMYASMLSSENIMDNIINRFNLMEVYNEDNRFDMYKKLDDLVEIKAGKKDGIISISVEDEEPRRAANIANAYVEELGKLLSEISMKGGNQNRIFLEERLLKVKMDLTKAEDALKSFQAKNKALDISEQAKGTIEGIANLSAQLAVEQVRLNSLRRVMTDTSQEVKNQMAVVSSIKSQISKFEGTSKASSIPSIGSVPALEQEYLRLMREFKTQEMLMELLTKQHELAKLSEAKSTTYLQIIQKGHVPDRKVKPKRSLIVIGITFFACFGSILWALFKDYLTNISEDELNRWLQVKSAFSWKRKLK